SAHAGSGPDSSREWAIRAAASLAEGWIGQGAEVEVILDGLIIAPPGGSSRARPAALLDELARLGSGGHRGLVELLADPEDWRRDRGLRVVVTTDVGLRGLGTEARQRDGDRFVVLNAGAFGAAGGGDPAAPWPVAPGSRSTARGASRRAFESPGR